MASGEIDVTPGKVLSDTELITPGKLNLLGTPTLRIKEQAVTSRELADGSINSDKLDVDLEAQIGVQDGAVTTQKLADGAVTSTKMAENARVPIGAVMDFAGATAPDGWLFCGGQTISRSTYAALFSKIGTTWGAGDGSTTFNVPDLRGFVCAGKDDMVSGASGRLTTAAIGNGGGPTALAGWGGTQQHLLTEAQMPSHAHGFQENALAFTYVMPSGQLAPGQAYAVANQVVGGATDYRGSGQLHQNCQPTRMLNKIIRYL